MRDSREIVYNQRRNERYRQQGDQLFHTEPLTEVPLTLIYERAAKLFPQKCSRSKGWVQPGRFLEATMLEYRNYPLTLLGGTGRFENWQDDFKVSAGLYPFAYS
jgi:hypothetical protein